MEDKIPYEGTAGNRRFRIIAAGLGLILLGLLAALVVSLSNRGASPVVSPTPTTALAAMPTAQVQVTPTAMPTQEPEKVAEVVQVSPMVTNTTNVTNVMVGLYVPSGVYAYSGELPAYEDFRSTVITDTQPGVENETVEGIFVWRFTRDYDHAVLYRVYPDDELLEAWLVLPAENDNEIIDLMPLLGMTAFDETPPSDPAERAAIVNRKGSNVAELLPQNIYAIDLGAVPSGSQLVFRVRDQKLINAGVGVVIGDAGDDFTVDLSGKRIGQ